jgi:predicted transcriptional regulator
MENHNISQLPILDGNVQVGSISETSVVHLMAAGEDIGKLLKMNVSKIMGGVLPSVGPDAGVDLVYKLLEQESAALVVDRGNVVGIVTRADLFKLRGRERIT